MLLLVGDLQRSIAITTIDLGLLILVGLALGRLAEKFKIPAVSGYLIAGLFLGPISGIISQSDIQSFEIITNIALGFIAFQVGNEFWLGKLKKTGRKVIIITIIQALLTTVVVVLVSLIFVELYIALVLGAIAAATAPAPIMMIVKKYHSKGELTDTLVPLVGFDDAVGVLIFSILLTISVSIVNPTINHINLLTLVESPLFEIGVSVLIGTSIGLVSGLLLRTIDKLEGQQEKNLDIIVIAVLLTTGVAMLFRASPILTPMISGAIVTNMIDKETYKIEELTLRSFIPPVMILFFTIAGASLKFDVILSAGVIGLIYIVSRTIGKMFGAYIGSVVTKSDRNIKRFLGFTLLPQSGVAIGLSVAAYNMISPHSEEGALVIKNVILASVLFFALIGPVLVKISLTKTGDIK
jgi:Kef-type K+ transport system membrane component KefB